MFYHLGASALFLNGVNLAWANWGTDFLKMEATGGGLPTYCAWEQATATPIAKPQSPQTPTATNPNSQTPIASPPTANPPTANPPMIAHPQLPPHRRRSVSSSKMVATRSVSSCSQSPTR